MIEFVYSITSNIVRTFVVLTFLVLDRSSLGRGRKNLTWRAELRRSRFAARLKAHATVSPVSRLQGPLPPPLCQYPLFLVVLTYLVMVDVVMASLFPFCPIDVVLAESPLECFCFCGSAVRVVRSFVQLFFLVRMALGFLWRGLEALR